MNVEKLNLNTATEAELCSLGCIGPMAVKRIMMLREELGGFSCIEDVKGCYMVGDGIVEKLKDRVYVEGAGEMDERDIMEHERALMSKAVSVPKDVRYKLCDMGYYNDAMKGYLIAGMLSAGFTESEIRKAVLGMRRAHDELTAEEAERVYTED